MAERPGRRNVSKACSLCDYLKLYFDSRKSELAEGTYRLHRYTARYLLAFFGEHRRIDQLTRADARAFKTALANGELKYINKKKRDLTATTVDLYIRNCRSMFNNAVTDDVVLYNPFDKVSKPPKLDKDWHYVTPDEYKKLTDYATPNIRLLISLCRLAGLRRGEALALEWSNIDWHNNRLTVITKEDRSWQPKDKDSRIVPIFPELQAILLDAYENAPDGQICVIDGTAGRNNFWRDFQVLYRKSGVHRYSKPYHSLRKSCIRDWAGKYPMHVVQAWAGHAKITTTAKYYLQVPESEYDRAASENLWSEKVTQKVTQKVS
ncbi:tyrosine-type recombinase/integrase [Planctomycetota bacterium]